LTRRELMPWFSRFCRRMYNSMHAFSAKRLVPSYRVYSEQLLNPLGHRFYFSGFL
jgi:hypothetical protein